MHLIFDDYDAWVLRSVHDERVPAVQDGAVAVSGIERHQRVTPLNLRRKARKNISIFEYRIVGDPDEIAGLVAYLASGESGYVTGSSLTIDGGMAL